MLRFTELLPLWQSPTFSARLQRLLAELDAAELPLQQGLRYGSYVSDEPRAVSLIATEDLGDRLRVRAGIHYSSIIAGCSCADDPTPVDTCSEYCEIDLEIDRRTGLAQLRLRPD